MVDRDGAPDDRRSSQNAESHAGHGGDASPLRCCCNSEDATVATSPADIACFFAGQTLMSFFRCTACLSMLFCLLLTPAHAARLWAGRVTHVTDGDTLWVQAFAGVEAHKLRLEGLDAPEACQAWGPQAHAALRSLLLGQVVQVRTLNRDAYGRRLSQVQYQGQDVGDWLVRQGHAWSSRFQGRSGRYDAAQQQAQLLRKGLFSQPGPWLTPRQFRQRYGACRPPQTGHPG